jgi:hypothetical protein
VRGHCLRCLLRLTSLRLVLFLVLSRLLLVYLSHKHQHRPLLRCVGSALAALLARVRCLPHLTRNLFLQYLRLPSGSMAPRILHLPNINMRVPSPTHRFLPRHGLSLDLGQLHHYSRRTRLRHRYERGIVSSLYRYRRYRVQALGCRRRQHRCQTRSSCPTRVRARSRKGGKSRVRRAALRSLAWVLVRPPNGRSDRRQIRMARRRRGFLRLRRLCRRLAD